MKNNLGDQKDIKNRLFSAQCQCQHMYTARLIGLVLKTRRRKCTIKMDLLVNKNENAYNQQIHIGY